jgi:hypothetical protein
MRTSARVCVCMCVCVLCRFMCVNVMSLAVPRPISPPSAHLPSLGPRISPPLLPSSPPPLLPSSPPPLLPSSPPPLLCFPPVLKGVGCRGVGFRERGREVDREGGWREALTATPPPPTPAPPPPQTSELLLVSQDSGMWANCFCETRETSIDSSLST